MSPRTVRPHPAALTLSLVGLALVLISGCKNWLEPCATGLVVRPALDSATVDSSRTFQAVVIGGCGFVPVGPTSAAWQSSDTTIARVADTTTSDGRAVVIGLRSGHVHILATAGDLNASATFVVQ